MKVSVIVVTYNQEETIGRTLESVLCQRTDFPFEIVIGDDCSTDGTQRVCEEYARRYPDKIRYIRRESNLGIVGNYFDCIEQSRGEYLADCAGDDYWVDADKLQHQSDYLDNHPEVTMVTGDWLSVDPQGKVSRDKRRPEVIAEETAGKGELLDDMILNRATPHLCSALYRRKVIMDAMSKTPEIMVNKDFGCEDMQIIMACNAAGAIVTLPGVVLHYSVGHDSISNSREFKKAFLYSNRIYGQKHSLVAHYQMKNALIDAYFRHLEDYMSALAFHSGDEECRSLSAGFKGGWKTSVYKLAMKNRHMWRILRTIHVGANRE